MPLRDHFRSPVNDKHRWDAVHGLWPGMLVRELFDLLPPPYQAEPKIHLGAPIEIDVAALADDSLAAGGPGEGAGGTATLVELAPTFTVEADLSEQDEYEVRIYDADRDRRLVAAIEIVSPSNKDRPDSREIFVGKVVSLLQQDVCVALVDLVSVRQANLYAEVLALLGRSDPNLGPNPPHLYAVSLRARKRPKAAALLDAWFFPLGVDRPLPALPLWLSADLRVTVPFESSYEETCRLLHIA
jgi:hypothetical protein